MGRYDQVEGKGEVIKLGQLATQASFLEVNICVLMF